MPNIRSSADLRNSYNDISTYCHSYNEPVFITKNGKGDLAVMSMETYEGISATLNMYQSLLLSEQQIKEGKVNNARESLKAVKEKYGL